MPLPWWEMSLTEAKDADAIARWGVKCVTVDMLSSSQKPSQRTNLEGGVIGSPMVTVSFERGPYCWIVRQ